MQRARLASIRVLAALFLLVPVNAARSAATAGDQPLVLAPTGGDWTLLSEPASAVLPHRRVEAKAAYDNTAHRTLVFGGLYNYTSFNDVWSLPDNLTPSWEQILPAGAPPEERYGHSAIYDPIRNQMVIFGGGNLYEYFADTWSLSLTGTPAWTNLNPSGPGPSARVGHGVIYDPVRDRMLLFGGHDGARRNDLWALSLSGSPAWTPLTATGTPPSPRNSGAVAYDPVRDRLLVIGGITDVAGDVSDVWELSLSGTPTWTQLFPSGLAPVGRRQFSATYDPAHDVVILFGGNTDQAGSGYGDVWSLSLGASPAWTNITPIGGASPGKRWGHTAVYAPVSGAVQIFGGVNLADWLNDTWDLTQNPDPAWAQVSPPPPPSPNPHLDKVKDVPNDQGGKVFVLWQASVEDGQTGNSVTGYRVWRRIPDLAPSLVGESARLDPRGQFATDSAPLASSRTLVRTDGAAVTYWEALATLPAQRMPAYGYTAATTQDSLPDSNPFSVFFVTAITADINVFYNSNVDSGYSVDNLPPQGPSGFQLAYSGQGASMQWLPNPESDIECYRLYRGFSADFVPAAENRVADQTGVTYTDPAGAPGTFYKLCAVDRHENSSVFATAGSQGAVGVDGSPVTRLSLAGPWPNPSRSGVFSVSVTHPHPGRVTFDVYDVRGTRVFSRRLDDAAPGTNTFTVGTDRALGAGLYMIRVTNGSEIRQLKTTVMQ